MVKITGGTNLEKALAEIAKKVSKAAKVDVGFLEDATYPDGTSVAMVAAIQEFGAPSAGIPPRPFFRAMIAAKSPEWPKAIGDLLTANDYDAAKTLDQAGAAIEGQLKESIENTFDPPLSPVTLMLRKMRADNPDLVVNKTVVEQARAKVAAGASSAGASTKPLVDSGHLLASTGHKVTGGSSGA
jgi:hypothetical protein